jgi:outer membrane protein TolC
MTFFRGHMPSTIIVTALLFSFAAQAQHNVPLTLAEAEDLALDQEPGHAALLARAAALEERSIVAGQLPDPMLRVGLNNYPLESGGFSTEGMTNAMVGVRQEFPPGETRSISTRQLQSMSAELAESAAARGLDVLTAARSSWLESYYWDRAHTLVFESRPFFDDLATVTRSLYAVGRKNQQDLLRAELELSRLDDRLIEIERRRASARAALGEWVGANADRPIASKLPAWNQMPSRAALRSNLLQHPAMKAADAQIDARAAGVDLADQRSRPGWALEAGYSYREGVLPDGQPRSDMISVNVTVGLPFFRKKSVDSSLSAALHERSAARASKQQVLRRLTSQLDAEYARWQDLTRRMSLYEEQILGQTEDQARAALVAYQSDSGDFADVMRGYIDDLNARLDHVRLQVERAQSYAMLANLGGLPR